MGTQTDQEDDDLELGFTNTLAEPSEPPAPPAASAPAAPTPPAPAPVKDAAPASPAAAEKLEPNVDVDPFEGVSPAVRDMLGDYQRLKAQFEEVRRTAGQVPALQREIDRLKTVVAPPPPAAAPRRFEKVEKLREEGLDDIAAALDEIGAAVQQPPPPPPPPAPAPASTEDDVGAKLDSVRPTWQQDLTSGEFLLWLSQQPGGFQNEMRTTADPDVIVGGLKKYDEFVANTKRAPAPGPRTQRMAAAAATPRGVGRAPIRQVVDDEEADMEAGLTGRATYQHTR